MLCSKVSTAKIKIVKLKMKNIAFVIWMVGAPMVEALDSYVNEYLLKNKYPDSAQEMGALVIIIIYIFVGTLLYEKKN
jgi:hypothetical protein